MTSPRFSALEDGRWSPAPPATVGAVAALARQSGVALPPDYLDFLARSNGGDGFLSAQPCYLRLWRAEEVIGYNQDYGIGEYVPGLFAFGDTGGSAVYAFDTRGPQPWPVVAVPFVPMEASAALPVAGSFGELLTLLVQSDAEGGRSS
jgi:hypothetical protein